MIQQRIGFIGAGQMATALAKASSKRGSSDAKNILAADPLPEARQRFTAATAVPATADNGRVAGEADVIFLAVKPQQIAKVLSELRGRIDGQKLVVSIAAGVPIAVLQQGLGPAVRLVRVMPNTPCLVGLGACAYCLGEKATADDAKLVEQLLSAVGIALRVEEKLLDAVTGSFRLGAGVCVYGDRSPQRWGSADGIAAQRPPRPWPPRRSAARPKWCYRPTSTRPY